MTFPKEPTYIKSIGDGIWQRPDQGAFSYSDGDEVEERIASTIESTSDLSVLSMELQSKICDWPSHYHFSAERANLLRPLSSLLTGSVLEIGSGCGAITRFLGETATEVVALEGSPRRAKITRLRTQDLNHVEVYCDEFSKFHINRTFDAVTLIGVLEYANLFADSSNPALKMLELARLRLNEDGHLIVAIENKLGLKYFAGAPEDHLGIPMIGVEDQYLPNGVRTYGRQELKTLFSTAGFSNIEFLYPFPDYKLPSCVLSEKALHDQAFDPTPFLVSSAGKDPQLSTSPAFCIERVWPSLVLNGVAQHFANSFLIVASNKPEDQPQRAGTDILAWHYSTQRQPKYCKETKFSKSTSSAGILIERAPITTPTLAEKTSPTYTQLINDETPYSDSPLLSSILTNIVTKDNWTLQQVADFIYLYIEQISAICGIALIKDKKVQWDATLPGKFLDCIPQNILLHPNGSSSAFDLEWTTTNRIPLTYLVFRSLWHALGSLSTIGRQAGGRRPSIIEIAAESIRISGKDISSSELLDYVRPELAFLESATGRPFDEKSIVDWLVQPLPRQQKAHQLIERCEQLTLAINTKSDELANQILLNEELAKTARMAEIRHQEEQSEARRLTQKQSELITELNKEAQQQEKSIAAMSRETLNNSAAIRKLTKNLVEQHLLRHSLKNLKKQALDYRLFLKTCDNAVIRSPQLLNIKAIAAATRTHWKKRPVVLLFTRTESGPLAEALLKQTCHWAIPYKWHFNTPTNEIAEAISKIATKLDITIKTSVTPAEKDICIESVLNSEDDNTIIAIPRTLNASEPVTTTNALPDSERVRLAYIALLSQHSINAIYVGLSTTPQESNGSSTTKPLLCMFRKKILQQMEFASSLLTNEIDTKDLSIELSTFNSGEMVRY